ESLPELVLRPPDDVVVLPRVEVGFIVVVGTARPDHGEAAAEGVAGLEVDARPVLCEVRDDEAAAVQLEDDAVVELVRVFDAAEDERCVAGDENGGSDREVVRGCKLVIEAHGDEGLRERRRARTDLLDPPPPGYSDFRNRERARVTTEETFL